jgi:hypothetical protein
MATAEAVETLEESLAQKPTNLRELAGCVGKTVKIDDACSRQVVVYAGVSEDSEGHHMFVHQRPTAPAQIREWLVREQDLWFSDGVVTLGKRRFQYNRVEEGQPRYEGHRLLLEEAGSWTEAT